MSVTVCFCTGRCRVPPYTCSGNSPYYAPLIPEPRQMTVPAPLPTHQQGCICPPTAEKTCESLTCPRKNDFNRAREYQQQMQEAMKQAQAQKNDAL